jgi:hypothetical protein
MTDNLCTSIAREIWRYQECDKHLGDFDVTHISPDPRMAALQRELCLDEAANIVANVIRPRVRNYVHVAYVYGFMGLAIFISILSVAFPACGAELLRDGPVQIEQPKEGGWTYPPYPAEGVIVRVDETGAILRRGKPIEMAHRDDLIAVVRELLAIEMMKSAPPRRK